MPRSYLVLTTLPLFDISILLLLLAVLLLDNCPPPHAHTQCCHSICCSQMQKGLVINLRRNKYMLDKLTSDVSYSAIGLV